MNTNEFTYVDFAILNAVRRCGQFQDVLLTQELRCPRTVLLTRLRFLLHAGYLTETEDGYALTELGLQKWVPLPPEPDSKNAPGSNPASFDWTKLYIPSGNWLT